MSIAHFTLATRDVIASRDFFAGTLGWEPIVELEDGLRRTLSSLGRSSIEGGSK